MSKFTADRHGCKSVLKSGGAKNNFTRSVKKNFGCVPPIIDTGPPNMVFIGRARGGNNLKGEYSKKIRR